MEVARSTRVSLTSRRKDSVLSPFFYFKHVLKALITNSNYFKIRGLALHD